MKVSIRLPEEYPRDAAELLRGILSHDFGTVPLYAGWMSALPHSVAGPVASICDGITGRTLDLLLAAALTRRGDWRGPGVAFIMRDGFEWVDCVAIACHEVAHAVEGGTIQRARIARRSTDEATASEVAEGSPFVADPPPGDLVELVTAAMARGVQPYKPQELDKMHGRRFVRALAHVLLRVEHSRECYVHSRSAFGCRLPASPGAILDAIEAEHRAHFGESIASILDRPEPADFAALWSSCPTPTDTDEARE